MHGEDTTEDHKPDQETRAEPQAADNGAAAENPAEEIVDEDAETEEPVSGYDDVSALFERLAATEPGSVAHAVARDALINRCIPLADHIARKFSGRGEPFDDLSQVARVGLVHAVDRFDLSRGSNFLSFAVPTIMGEVRRYFRDNTWAMRVPRRVKETHLRIGAAVDQLSQRLGRSPTAKEIAAELEVDPDEVTQAVIAGNAYQPTSIDAASVGRDSDASLLDTLGEEESQFDRVEEYIAVRPLPRVPAPGRSPVRGVVGPPWPPPPMFHVKHRLHPHRARCLRDGAGRPGGAH
ncbi:sigma-70 family RNA polymerase sigma factor, partial [Nocardia sp. NPDC060259]|uniref:sigma-70 family RNA polymerase sigma factor n=1 Tax=Nocardia sp. NPDC060259 TaxID=3347088 RepID=UPI003651AABE